MESAYKLDGRCWRCIFFWLLNFDKCSRCGTPNPVSKETRTEILKGLVQVAADRDAKRTIKRKMKGFKCPT